VIPAAKAAHTLLLALAARGIECSLHSNAAGVSTLELPGVNVWASASTGFSWHERPRAYARHPLIDLQETADSLVRRTWSKTIPC
jgi:hypothetical protein